MSAMVLAVVGLAAFAVGYLVYSRFIAERIYRLAPDFVTPSHSMEDGVDYVPTNRFVLWGHHFTSVAGAAPIIGPAIAVIWGWVPAFLWVVFGTIFFAGVHDFGAIWASVRNRGRSIGALTEDVVGRRARSVFMIVIFLLLLMVNTVFAVAIAKLFISFPSSVLPAWSAIAVALVIGYLIYRRGVGLLWPSLIGVMLLYFAIYLGDFVPIELTEGRFGLAANAQWIVILFMYAALASLLPIWLLLQPRDYINGLQLIVGLCVLYGAVLILSPSVVAPTFNANAPEGTPPLVPLLFVTIACGAVSGFHGLVSSGTTSKQLDKETDARLVGYLGAVGEGSLALVTIVVTTAGFATLAEWEGVYSEFGGGSLDAFVSGGANVIAGGLGLPREFAVTLLTVMAVLFAGTTMDTGVRLQRYIIQEWGNIYNLPWLTNKYLATLGAVGCCLALAFGAGGASGEGGLILWPLFGTTNQLLGGLTLSVITVMLVKVARPVWYTLVPLVFLLTMTIFALVYQLAEFYQASQWLLLGIDGVILIAAILVALESLSAFIRERQRLVESAGAVE
jgi:carbon starvation protein